MSHGRTPGEALKELPNQVSTIAAVRTLRESSGKETSYNDLAVSMVAISFPKDSVSYRHLDNGMWEASLPLSLVVCHPVYFKEETNERVTNQTPVQTPMGGGLTRSRTVAEIRREKYLVEETSGVRKRTSSHTTTVRSYKYSNHGIPGRGWGCL